MAPAVGHVLPIGGEALHRLGSLIDRDAQGAGDVAGEKGLAGPGVEQHENPSSVLHLVLDGVDLDFAEKLGFVVGLETRQLLGRRLHARTSLLSMELFVRPGKRLLTPGASAGIPETHPAFPLSPRLSSPPVPLSLRDRGDYEMIPGSPR